MLIIVFKDFPNLQMAEPVVSIVLDTIRDLLVGELKFCFGIKSQVEEIQRQLQRMRSFLKDADSKQEIDDRVHNWVAEVREAAYDIEDNVLIFVTVKISTRNSRNLFRKLGFLFREIITTYSVGSKISDIRSKISGLTTSLETYGINPISDQGEVSDSKISRVWDLRRSYSHVVEDDFVGLQDDIKLLVSHLIDEYKDPVVSIYGMGGLGKTTIARKLYSHRDVRRHFDGYAWTCVSQQWDKKDILQGILIKLMPEKRHEIIDMRDEELVKQLHDVQLKKKCLVVLDDIWSIQAWETLKSAFPNTRTGAGSKILLTSRNREVVFYVNPSGYHYELRFLSNEESWELLEKKAFPRREDGSAEFRVDEDMMKLGKDMVGRCCGLPLAILVLGGLLVTRRTLREWQIVYDNINWYLAKGRGHGQQPQAVTEVLAFSYYNLPFQFKQCFLYLANFPEDFEIEAEKLYQLWLAEGIISQEDKAKDETMMDVAERYLAELAQRCMVQVSVKETAGGFKNCRLHDLMRDLCISQAKVENFTKILDFRREKESLDSYSSSNTTRRISVYLGPNDMHRTRTCSENHHIRSAFFYANDCSEKYLQKMKSHIGSFKLLRVLLIQGYNYADELPKAIGSLIHLRYLGLSYSQFKKLPTSLGKLIYLQTLYLEAETLLEIPNVLWKMKRLKHLYLPGDFRTQDGKKLRLDGLSELETLVNFNTSLCDVKDLDGLTNLRKLRAAIKDKLDDLPNIIKYISFTQNHLRRSSLFISCPQFCSDEEQNLLRTLLGCHRLYKLSIRASIGKLPEHYHFSSTIAKITFSASALDEDPMTILEKLPKLSSLSFYDSTFVGEDMTCLDNGFPQLLYLKLWGLSNLKRWRINKGAMPKLTRLVIANCEKMEMIPDGIKFVTTLQKLNVRMMSDNFKDRLRAEDNDEGEDYYKVRHVAQIKID